MHAEAYAFIRKSIAKIPKPSLVIEIGSLNINGSPRGLLPDVPYLGIDRRHGKDVDIIADGATYEPMAKADLVLCCEVLEHAENAAAVTINAVNCLAPGGHLIVTCATDGRHPHSGYDGATLRAGEYYGNVKPTDLKSWIETAGAEVLLSEIYLNRGDLYALARVPA